MPLLYVTTATATETETVKVTVTVTVTELIAEPLRRIAKNRP